MSRLLVFITLSVFYLLYRFITAAIQKQRLQRLAKERGCKPVHVKDAGFFGIPRFRAIMAHSKTGTAVQFMAESFKTRGTYMTKVFGKQVISTADPVNIKAMLATQFDDFSLEYRQVDFEPLMGEGIFNSNGKAWLHSRAMLRPQFSRSQISDLKALEVHVQRMLALIPTDGTEFDIQTLFFRLTVDSATEFLFGKCTDTLLEKDGVSKMRYGNYSFPEAFGDAQDWSLLRLRLGPLSPIAWLFPSYHACHKAVNKIMEGLIASSLSEMKLNPPSTEKEYVPKDGKYIFLHALAHETTDNMLQKACFNYLQTLDHNVNRPEPRP